MVDGNLIGSDGSVLNNGVQFQLQIFDPINSKNNCGLQNSEDCFNLTFNVSSINTDKSLDLLPAMTTGYAYNLSRICTSYSSGCASYESILSSLNSYPLNPQLWVLIDNNQLSGLDNKNNGLSVGVGTDPQTQFSYSFSSPQALALGIEGGSTPVINVDGVKSPSLSFESLLFSLFSVAGSVPMFDSWLDFYDPTMSAFNGVLSNLNEVESLLTGTPVTIQFPNQNSITFNLPPGGVVNFESGYYNVGSYLSYVANLLNETALWRSRLSNLWCEPSTDGSYDNVNYCRFSESDWYNFTAAVIAGSNPWLNTTGALQLVSLSGSSYSDPGAPLKYFNVNFSFFKVFSVVGCNNDKCFYVDNKNSLTSNSVQCNSIAPAVNDYLENVSESFKGVNFSHLIPRGFYVVNYTYSVDSNGIPIGGYSGYPGWNVQSQPLVLDNSNYYQATTRCGPNNNPSNPSTPLCGFIMSTNQNQPPLFNSITSELGNCIFSSGNLYTWIDANFGWNSNNYGWCYNSFKNQIVNGNVFFSSFIPVNFSRQQSLANVGDFVNVVGSSGNGQWSVYDPSNSQYFTPFVVDDAGDVGVPYCGAANSVEISNVSGSACNTYFGVQPSALGPCNGVGKPSSNWIWPYFDGLGLH
jgi:hypothetical protein